MAPFNQIELDYVEFAVADLEAQIAAMSESLGLIAYAAVRTGDTRSVAIGRGEISMVLTQAVTEDHEVASYVQAHGDGVANFGLRVPDAAAAFNEAVSRGARPVRPPETVDGIVTAAIMGFGDVVHTFVERQSGVDSERLPGLAPLASPAGGEDLGLRRIDHIAICLEAGHLRSTIDFYEQVLDFATIYSEHIVVGNQAMNSQVVAGPSGGPILTLLEPDVTEQAGQLDQFIKDHGGAGVQHIAFSTNDVVRSVAAMSSRGVDFLQTPGAYYDALAERLELSRHSVPALRELNILVDEDHDGQLFQIFCRSAHPRNTFFFEVIERAGANTFGSGNIKALYQAVEAERSKAGAGR
ncbi:4-hydroxyphenylpyruvate dioxygenase [Kibdelosporangium aridum]|uniref:4-hydroxyphenylpyruvate dioxygenase n=1 Tax=Kibdelosporangium aridum TaxID=2030 RepID=A0A428Z0X1_KIBAR|nr:4-hydroxyphenylpyruvate dioxygenase [Kibdelosporangium aridum]RSM78016.1 4-hydroxyphenylpyruvate dioxygenase [Kibdelosporangium aridum]